MLPQLIPAGLLVTVPLPVPARLTVSVIGLGGCSTVITTVSVSVSPELSVTVSDAVKEPAEL